MIRIIAGFIAIVVLSLAFHLILGGDQQISLEQVVISFNLKDILLGILLASNVLAVICLLRHKF